MYPSTIATCGIRHPHEFGREEFQFRRRMGSSFADGAVPDGKRRFGEVICHLVADNCGSVGDDSHIRLFFVSEGKDGLTAKERGGGTPSTSARAANVSVDYPEYSLYTSA
jgi:hypothetical protein